ncbi:MAG: hypothetical protein FP816_01660 [Desulfobacteraceae bacterium]|nr:hypothetical protein [Desulfobacteraceae bacterium]
MAFSRKMIPLVAFLFFSGLAVFLWHAQNRHEQELVRSNTQMTSEQIKVRVEGLMNARMACLDSMAFRWLERTPADFSKNRFLGLAGSFYTRFPGFTGINWIDTDGVVRWVFPDEANKNVIDQVIIPQPNLLVQNKSQKSEEDFEYSNTPCMKIPQGGLGFNTFWPLVYDGRVQGYLNGAFQVEQIVDICLPKIILNEFSVRLFEGKQLIYSNANSVDKDPPENNRLQHLMQEIKFHGKNWQLDLSPKTAVYSSGIFQNFSILVFGLTISIILSLLLYFLLQRMQAYRQARDLALDEAGKRKRAEGALKLNEKRLEGLVAELANKNAELETFVFSVSHDLKSPIVTIEGYLGALYEDFGDIIPEDGKKYLNYIGDASRKMELLIKDLLDLSRIGRLKIRKTEFSFSALINETLELLQPQLKNRNVEVRVDKGLPLVYGEKKRLAQVMENLLINAIKYMGRENPAPYIEIGSFVQNDEPIFFVKDNGIGIEKKHFDLIFLAFQRLPIAKKIGEGTGLGLSIVKRIVEYHGGRIWVESGFGKGTTFFFTLKDKETWTDDL